MINTIVVLGAGGFLGRYICREFSLHGHRVVAVGHTSPAKDEAARFVRGDLLEMDLEAVFSEEKPRWVVNAAGTSSVSKSFEDPYKDWQQTVNLQARVLDGLKKYIPNNIYYVFLSSAAVYGEPQHLPISEDAPCCPISPYGMHKWQAELLQEGYGRFFGLKGAVLRIFSAYGEGLNRQVVYELKERIRQSEKQLVVYGTGAETRDFIHAIDVARAVYHISNKEASGIFNVASGHSTSIADLAKQLVMKIKPELSISFSGKGKTGDPVKWEADISRLCATGFCISHSVMD